MRTRAVADPHSLLAEYLQHLRACRYSQASIEKASLVLPRLFEHLRTRDVRTITEAQLVAYLARQREAKSKHSGELLSSSTLVSTANTIRRFFAFLERTGVLLHDPSAQIALPRVRALPRDVLSEAQARRLMAVPFPASVIGKRDRAILETLYGTGLRLAELVRCDLGDVDLAQGLLLVKNGKGRKDRLVPMPGRACVALRVYLDEARPELQARSTPALFISRFGERLGRQAVQRLTRGHGRALRLHVSPHTLRHSCATHLLQGGADVRHVQQLLGHKRVTTTAVYTRVAVADLRKVLGRAHPRPQAQLRPRPDVTLEVLRDVVQRAHPRHTPDDLQEG